MAQSPPAAPDVPVIAPLAERFADIRSIAVLRGGGLGDVLFALPAMQALTAAYPQATVTLLGTPVHRALFEGRKAPPHHVEVLPISRGVRDPAGSVADPGETERFFERMRASGIDLALQLHGGGRWSNPFLLQLGARHTAGMRTPDAQSLERSMPYVYYQHETLRALEVVGMVGAPPVAFEPELSATVAEHEEARGLLLADSRAVVVLHPGATDPRRRWPADRFAEVAGRLIRNGVQVVVVGDESDLEAAATIVGIARGGLPDAVAGFITSLAGRLTLSQLVGLLSHADLLLGNDSGPRHLAHALGVRTAAIYWFGNLINAGPLGRSRHRVQLSWTTRCPVCGSDATQVGWTAERCEHDVSFVDDVDVDAVADDVEALLVDAVAARPSTAQGT